MGHISFLPYVTLPDSVFIAVAYDGISNPHRSFGAFISESAPVVGSNGQISSQDSLTLAWTPYTQAPAAYNIEMNIHATACYADCDLSPVLNVNDFVCFMNRFAAGHPYANCDGSTTPPIFNVNDFICYQSRFAAGCS